ncbi:MFS transporter [Citrobacter amalonaticus]|uniref:MFS transporter n=1 Tax=Citrobacter amalonaticus TaxID=35703 RepID=A0A2S4RZ44_CITAM|nr:MFS transporter [Citrobacter amalonaticus]POT57558.1 MFS transporter [Citrobacter amalonaticus]POT76915.1 MFS transporter [Citrobacter amalonaticus]POU65994.1 MFS transporter [Citrobacter amalonaticus]POV06151.1 MFS transporter [Citrobacter amalonaticus]
MKNSYLPTAAGLYLNYLVHGMGVILMSLNMSSLEQQWQTNAAGVSVVISSLGIGRLSVLFCAGLLSDRFGRRPFIILGMLCYLAFFFGILNTHNIIIAYAFGFLAGMANSFLDAGTYPSLMEAFPASPGTANILIKAFVSGGQFLLPMIISLLVWAELWFGWSFIIAAAIMILNGLFLFRCTFPPHPGRKLPPAQIKPSRKPAEKHRCLLIDLVSYTLYGYISMATFYLISQWLAQYGQFVAGMSYTLSIKLLSIYTCGSLLCVFITAPLVRKTVRSTTLLMLYTFISFVALLTVCLYPNVYVVIVFAFVIGFSSAGGVVQIGLTLMAARFPLEKGKATGIYYSAGSIATFTIPLVTAHLSERSIADIMWFDTGIAAVGFLLALFIGYRSRMESRRQVALDPLVE